MPNKKLGLQTLVSVCIGLDISADVSFFLLEKAGFKIKQEDVEDRAYAYLLSFHSSLTITECNDILDEISKKEEISIKPLGSMSHREKQKFSKKVIFSK